MPIDFGLSTCKLAPWPHGHTRNKYDLRPEEVRKYKLPAQVRARIECWLYNDAMFISLSEVKLQCNSEADTQTFAAGQQVDN